MIKDIERARREADERETAKMMQAINENHERAFNKWLMNEQVKKITREKKEKKEVIINFVWIVLTIIVLAGLMGAMLAFLKEDTEQFMKGCSEAGYSESYCRSQL